MPKVAAIVLAAGEGARFLASGGGVKVLADFQGEPLVRRAAKTALASNARPVVVVIGAAAAAVRAALDGLALNVIDNKNFRDGLSSSLSVGLGALPQDVDGALILLADMPGVDAELLNALIAAFQAGAGVDAALPVRGGNRGNPALLGRTLFAPAMALEGDEGAGRLLQALPRVRIREVEAGEAIFQDADTQRELAAISGKR